MSFFILFKFSMFYIRPSNRVEIRNVNSSVTPEVIEGLVSSCGTVKKVQLGTSSSVLFRFYLFIYFLLFI